MPPPDAPVTSRRFGCSQRIRRIVLGLAVIPMLASCSGTGNDLEVEQSPHDDATALADMRRMWVDFYQIVDAPDVDVVRWVRPEEMGETQDDCLRAAGFQVDAPGQVYYPEEQKQAADLAQYTCRMQYPVMSKYTQEWGSAQLDLQYEWTVEYVVPCLQEQGHPTADIPTKEVFTDQWATDPFYPFAQIKLDLPADAYNAEWYRLETVCPQIAPSTVLWDSMTINEWQAAHGRGG